MKSKLTDPIKLDFDYASRPSVKYWFKKRPSWRSCGDGGACIEMHLERNGSIAIKAAEWPENNRGGKEVYVELSPEKVMELKKLLNEYV